MLPKAIYFSIKGILTPMSIFRVLGSPLLCVGILFALGFFIPSVPDFIETHPAIGLGCNLNLIYMVYNYIFTERNRKASQATFWIINFKYRTYKWEDHYIEQQAKEKIKLEDMKELIDNRLKNY